MKNKKLYRWFSICSIHREYDKDCNCCKCGKWVFMPKYYLTHFLLSFPLSIVTYPIWHLYRNRKSQKIKWKNSFTNKETGEKLNPFPNLREKKED